LKPRFTEIHPSKTGRRPLKAARRLQPLLNAEQHGYNPQTIRRGEGLQVADQAGKECGTRHWKLQCFKHICLNFSYALFVFGSPSN